MGVVRTLVLASWVLLAMPAGAAEISLKTADGKTVAASQFGSGERGVVLVHDAGRSGTDWSNFAGRLSSNGFSVVVVDLRGHGASKAVADPIADEDWPKMVAEVDAAAAWLSSNGSTTVAVVGAALGANLALVAASDNPAIGSVVMLSPGLSAKGVRLGDALTTYKGSIYVVADAKDQGAVRTAKIIGDNAPAARVDLVAAGTSGHRMLNTVTSLEATLVGWLNGATGEGASLARPERTLSTAAPDGIETTGETYGGGR